jgi:periplasmic copper chaperone A
MRKFDLKYVTVSAAALLSALALSLPARAADYDVGSIHISQPWSRATPKGASAGAGYMTITNNGSTPDRVNCVSSDAAAQCQIHTMTMDNGVMKMRPVEGGLEILPGQTITLKPGGFHMMLLDLKHPLEAGGTMKATLKFDHAGTVDVEYPVAALGAPAPGAADAGGGNSTMMSGDHGGTMMMAPSGGGSMMQQKKQ